MYEKYWVLKLYHIGAETLAKSFSCVVTAQNNCLNTKITSTGFVASIDSDKKEPSAMVLEVEQLKLLADEYHFINFNVSILKNSCESNDQRGQYKQKEQEIQKLQKEVKELKKVKKQLMEQNEQMKKYVQMEQEKQKKKYGIAILFIC